MRTLLLLLPLALIGCNKPNPIEVGVEAVKRSERLQHLESCWRESTEAKRFLSALLVLFFYANTALAFNLTPTSVKGLTQAYGFIAGQDYSLSQIENEFSELATDIVFVRAQFNLTFPEIKAKLEKQLKLAMGERSFEEFKVGLPAKLKDTLGRQKITKEIAVNFLQKVKERSNGEIESPVLEYLLAVEYADNPAGEFADKFRKDFATDGTDKSLGIKLNMQLPRSWQAEIGKRPHIVQKWTSENGTGLEMILLDIRDVQGYNPTKKEMEEFVRSGEVKEIVPEGSKYLASGNFSLEKQHGYWIQMAMPLERAGIKMFHNSLIYQFFFRGKAIGIVCQAGGSENEKSKIDDAFKRIQSLCQRVLNSVVLPQAY